MPVVVEAQSIFFNNRINLEPIMDQIQMFAPQDMENEGPTINL